MSSIHFQGMYSSRFQVVFSVTFFRLARRLRDIWQDVFKASSRRHGRQKNYYPEDVLKT